jgi:hypothetical protein
MPVRACRAKMLVRFYGFKPVKVTATGGVKNLDEADEVKVVSFEQSFLNTLADKLTHKNAWNVLVSDDELDVTIGEDTLHPTPVLG